VGLSLSQGTYPLAAGVGTLVSPAWVSLVVFGSFVYMYFKLFFFFFLNTLLLLSEFLSKYLWSLKLAAQLLLSGGAGLIVQALETL